MSGSLRRYFVGFLALALIPLLADWAIARGRLDDVQIEARLYPPQVIADGESSTLLTVRVTENGVPRDGDLVQLWVETGGGLLAPQWVYTDQNGKAEITYTPNPATPYDLELGVTIHILDTSVGRLIEVGKKITIEVPLTIPDS